MNTLLRLDASARQSGSHSRRLGNFFVERWLARHPGAQVITRDLQGSAPPHISEATIAAMFTPADELTNELRQAMALSDQLIAELKAADAVLITTPMYNFGVPSSLKAWIDQVVRIGHTFAVDGTSFAGLLSGKRAYIVCSYGTSGYRAGGELATADFAAPYLRHVLSFIGFEQVELLPIEATSFDTVAAEADAARARARIEQLLSGKAAPRCRHCRRTSHEHGGGCSVRASASAPSRRVEALASIDAYGGAVGSTDLPIAPECR